MFKKTSYIYFQITSFELGGLSYDLNFFQFPGGLPPGMPGMPPGAPRIDVPVSLGSSLLGPPRGSDPLMSLGPSAPGPSGPHNSGPGGMRAPNSNDKVTRLYFSRTGKWETL